MSKVRASPIFTKDPSVCADDEFFDVGVDQGKFYRVSAAGQWVRVNREGQVVWE